jgi:hypothetical protein
MRCGCRCSEARLISCGAWDCAGQRKQAAMRAAPLPARSAAATCFRGTSRLSSPAATSTGAAGPVHTERAQAPRTTPLASGLSIDICMRSDVNSNMYSGHTATGHHAFVQAGQTQRERFHAASWSRGATRVHRNDTCS